MAPVKSLAGFACGLGILCAAPAAQASDKEWQTASTAGAAGLVGLAFALPLAQGDDDGLLQAADSIGAAAGISYGLKRIFPEWRPDHSDRKSFPSSHTAIAFAAAATLTNRDGWQVGLPAQIVAAFVGAARVRGHRHHWGDVAVGAAIGELSGFLITRKKDDRIAVIPWADTKGGGVALAMRF